MPPGHRPDSRAHKTANAPPQRQQRMMQGTSTGDYFVRQGRTRVGGPGSPLAIWGTTQLCSMWPLKVGSPGGFLMRRQWGCEQETQQTMRIEVSPWCSPNSFGCSCCAGLLVNIQHCRRESKGALPSHLVCEGKFNGSNAEMRRRTPNDYDIGVISQKALVQNQTSVQRCWVDRPSESIHSPTHAQRHQALAA